MPTGVTKRLLTGGAGVDLVVDGRPGNCPVHQRAGCGWLLTIGVLTGWSGEVPTAALMTKWQAEGITVGGQEDQANMIAAVEAHDMHR